MARVVRFLAAIEVKLEDHETGWAPELAGRKLDDFRESVRPAAEYGITIYRIGREEVEDEFPSDGDVEVLGGTDATR